jgi:hypothetical protein
MAQLYDVTTFTVRPGTHPQALAALEQTLRAAPGLLACWYCEIGAVNRILIIREGTDAGAQIEARLAVLNANDPFGIGAFITDMAMDSYVSLDFVAPMRPGEFGPCYEVRSYTLKPGGLPPTVELWRQAVPGRVKLSPLLAAMVATSGAATRFLHIWPYKTFDERARLRSKAVADGVWPPLGGPTHLASQQVDIYLPASFSPLR